MGCTSLRERKVVVVAVLLLLLLVITAAVTIKIQRRALGGRGHERRSKTGDFESVSRTVGFDSASVRFRHCPHRRRPPPPAGRGGGTAAPLPESAGVSESAGVNTTTTTITVIISESARVSESAGVNTTTTTITVIISESAGVSESVEVFESVRVFESVGVNTTTTTTVIISESAGAPALPRQAGPCGPAAAAPVRPEFPPGSFRVQRSFRRTVKLRGDGVFGEGVRIGGLHTHHHTRRRRRRRRQAFVSLSDTPHPQSGGFEAVR